MKKQSGYDRDDIYLDQAVFITKHKGRQILAAYTPDGIRMLDTVYANCIMAGVGTKEQLQQHIEENPHLHQTLKDNLILNLRHYNCVKNPPEADRKLLEKKLNMRSLKFD